MTHPTFEKGYLGVAKVIHDLAQNGLYFALPGCEQLPFDVIAISPAGDMKRLQVKFRAATKGYIVVPLRSSAGYTRIYEKFTDLSKIDAFAIYCPETDCVYYVNTTEVPQGRMYQFTLKLEPPKNKQVKGIRMAEQFMGPKRLFE